MMLYDLINSTTVQGNIIVEMYNDEKDAFDEKHFEFCDDLADHQAGELEEWLDREVIYIFPLIEKHTKVTKEQLPWPIGYTECLVIEVGSDE